MFMKSLLEKKKVSPKSANNLAIKCALKVDSWQAKKLKSLKVKASQELKRKQCKISSLDLIMVLLIFCVKGLAELSLNLLPAKPAPSKFEEDISSLLLLVLAGVDELQSGPHQLRPSFAPSRQSRRLSGCLAGKLVGELAGELAGPSRKRFERIDKKKAELSESPAKLVGCRPRVSHFAFHRMYENKFLR